MGCWGRDVCREGLHEAAALCCVGGLGGSFGVLSAVGRRVQEYETNVWGRCGVQVWGRNIREGGDGEGCVKLPRYVVLRNEAGKVYFLGAAGHRVLEYQTGVWGGSVGKVWGRKKCGPGRVSGTCPTMWCLRDEAGRVYFFSAAWYRVLEYETGVWGKVWGKSGQAGRNVDVSSQPFPCPIMPMIKNLTTLSPVSPAP